MRILVTGARGMVGTSVCQSLKDHDLIAPSKAELNVTRLSQVMKFDCDFIIHLACETDHEYCDDNPSQCYFANTIGTGNMVRLAIDKGIPILYLSTASIFDGKKNQPYAFNDIPNPINHYNISKYYGEVLVQNWARHFILRAGWMFGGGEKIDKKFVNKFMTKIHHGEQIIKVADDCIGSPTYTNDLAEYIKFFVENKLQYGVYNATNASNGGVSRYEFAKEIVNILDLDCIVQKCSIDDLKQEFPCKRTNYEVLENNTSMRDWKEALKEYLNANYRY